MNAVIYVVYLLLLIYTWLIVARVILSWFPARFNSPIYPIKRALFWLTEPYLGLFRRFLPMRQFGGVLIDWSAFLGLVVLFIAVQMVARA
jgi:YggT family protein